MMENIKKVLLTEEQIATRVKELGAELTAEYKGKEVIVIALLPWRRSPISSRTRARCRGRTRPPRGRRMRRYRGSP